MNPSTVAILGTGAVARMLAYFLKSVPDLDVVCYGRSGPRMLRYIVKGMGQDHQVTTDFAKGTVNLCLVTTKAYDLRSALEQWIPQIPIETPVVVLCNGAIENELQSIRQQYPERVLREGVVSRGARLDSDGVLYLGIGGTVVWGGAGNPVPLEASILKGLSAQGFSWDPASRERRREKWFFNTVLNTLSGAHRMLRNDEVPGLAGDVYSRLQGEVFALGCELWSDWKPDREDLGQKLAALITATAANENSMARDLRMGRKTEADFLSGLVVGRDKAEERFPLLVSFHRLLSQ